MAADMNRPTGISRARLVVLSLLFLGPLAAAFVWYYGLDADLAPGQTNHAPLVIPPVPLEDFENPGYGGGTVSLADMKRKWRIVHVVGDTCGPGCETLLYNTRQVRLAVGKNAHRVARVVLVGNPELVERLRRDHPDADLIMPADRGVERQLVPIIQRRGPDSRDALLIDPLGNVMMVIPHDLDPKLLLKDLKKLLKLSRIG